jgi:Spy/CpxP family protein refolding chaperone
MKNLIVVAMVICWLCGSSLMAQHGQMGEHAKHGESVEKIIEIIGSPGDGAGGELGCGHMRSKTGCSSFGHCSSSCSGSDHVMMMARFLDLTDEQQAKMKEMQLEFDLKMVDAKASVKKAKLQLEALMHDEASDESKVFSAIDKVAEKEADVKKMKFANKQKMHSILTKEQLEKAKQMHSAAPDGHKVFEWYSDGQDGDNKLIEFHGEGVDVDKEGNVFIMKKEKK